MSRSLSALLRPIRLRRRHLLRGGAAVVAALGAVLLAGAPAFAEDTVEVNLSGLSNSMTPGARPDTFTVKATNKTKNSIQPIRRVIVIRLAGLDANQIRVTRGLFPLSASGSSGQVTFTDQLAFGLGKEGDRTSSSTATYSIQFLADAPGGRATVTAEAVLNGNVLGTDSDSITVRGTAQAGSPTKTVPNTEPGVIPTFETNGPQTFAPLDDNTAAGAGGIGAPVALYVTGGLLVAAGGATLWLLFRRRPQLVEVPGSGQVYGGAYPNDYEAAAPTLGYPAAHAAPTAPLRGTGNVPPTAVLPAIRDPHTPPPVDPWNNAPPHP